MSGYEQSKWVAEQLLLEAASRGLAVKIFRPASIYADSQSGRGNEGDLIYRIIRGFVELKSYPLTNRDLDLTPGRFEEVLRGFSHSFSWLVGRL